MMKEIKTFCCYAHQDQPLLEKLKTYFVPLQREGLISVWYDAYISPGTEWDKEISKHLNTADIILLLISPDFMASEYCHEREIEQAMERYERGEASVIPVLLKHAYWQAARFGKLQVLPTNAQPVTSDHWHTQEDALFNVAEEIRKVAKKLNAQLLSGSLTPAQKYAILPREGDQNGTRGDVPEIQGVPAKEATLSPPSSAPKPPRFSRRAVLLGLAGGGVVGTTGGYIGRMLTERTQQLIPHLPAPQVPRGTLLSTYNSPSATITLAWSPDGKRIVLGLWGDDTTRMFPVQIWNTIDRGIVSIYYGHSSHVVTVAWSPNGNYIASGSWDQTVQVWDPTNGKTITTYKGHTDTVVSLRWSPDSTYIISGGAAKDGTVQVWNAISGEKIFVYNGHSGTIGAVAWSPDGEHIVFGNSSGGVQIGDIKGNFTSIYKGHTASIRSLAWFPNSKLIASGSDDTTVHIWDATNGNHIYTYSGHSDHVQTVAWSPNGKYIASASEDKTARVWNAADGSNVYIHPGQFTVIIAVAWSPDSINVASSDQGGFQVWKAVEL